VRAGLAGLVVALLCVAAAGCQTTGAGAELEAAREARRTGDLRRAHGHYQAVLAVSPGHEAARVERDAVRRAIADEAEHEAGALAADGSATALRSALARLAETRPYDPDGSLVAEARRGYEERLDAVVAANRAREQTARAALDARDFERAQAEIEAIRASDPSDPGLPALEAAYREASAAQLSARLAAQLEADDVPGARHTVEALEELVGAAGAAEARAKLEAREVDWLKARVAEDREARRFYAALARIRESGRGDALGELPREIRDEGAAFYADQARLRLERGETARAYLEALKGLELDPQAPGLFEAHRDARDAELAKLQTYVAVPTFGAPSDRPDSGARLSDALMNHLFDVLPLGVHLIERDEIDGLIGERRSFAEIGDLLNVDLIVAGNVSLLRVERQERKQPAVARVKVGTRREPNPAYDEAVRRGVQGDALPPRTVEVPITESVRYETGAVTAKGFAEVSLRIFDSNRGAIVDADQFSARYEKTDEFRDAVAGSDVAGDPLELPTETEILESLRDELVTRITDRILQHFGRRQHDFVEQVRDRLARRERELAVVPLAAGLLYCAQADVAEDDPDLRALRDWIAPLSEGDFL
jgi:hypothetical protein